MISIKSKAIKIFLFGLFFELSIFMLYCFFLKETCMSQSDFFLIMLSSIFTSGAMSNISTVGIKADNLFFLVFYGIVYLNQFDISQYQLPKDTQDFYYLSIGPILFGFFLRLSESRKKNRIDQYNEGGRKKSNGWKYIAIAYIVIMGYLYSKTGIRFFSGGFYSGQETDYIVPGLSGISYILSYMLLMQTPNMQRKEKILIVGMLVMTQGVFGVHRGEMMRIFIYIFISYMCSKKENLINKKNISKIIVVLLVLVIFFGVVGNYRQNTIYEAENAITTFSITKKIKSRIDSSIINWIYAYTAINIDVLKASISMIPSNKNVKIEFVFLPLDRLINGNSSVEEYYSRIDFGGISGINATTFLEPYIYDMGKLFFVELLIAGIVYSLFLIYSKKYSRGTYYFIIMLISLTVFGDYMFSPNRFYAIIASLVFERCIERLENINEKRFFDIVRA
ncbi:hypothetical protein C824_005961 [Schaedlerella arabinosiphila]|nr:hypothetical protein C824_005961 [Schaedlerella arabinosiphila]